MHKLRTPLWLVKIFHYEYWTWWAFYIPLLPYYLWLALKSRSLTFFTAANPGIEYGGFFGESKIDILNKIDSAYKPKTVLVSAGHQAENVPEDLKKQGISFPVIAKPNIGERGLNVQKINNPGELQIYIRANGSADFIIQEFVDFETELGILYFRFPGSPTGQVSSVTIKEFLKVKGDGSSSVLQLMRKNNRARFQIKRLFSKPGADLFRIPEKNGEIILEFAGNHCLGTKFLNGNHLIKEKLISVFDAIAKPVDGFYYGRFDIKVKSVSDLYEGRNIKIMELNGVSSDPTHIFDPGYSLFRAYRDLAKHWKIIYRISSANRKNGIKPVPFSVLLKTIKEHFKIGLRKP